MLDGAKPVKHRLTSHFVVDAGTACFAGHEPALSDDERDSLLSPNPEQLGDPPWLAEPKRNKPLFARRGRRDVVARGPFREPMAPLRGSFVPGIDVAQPYKAA